jgi:hypothetical protein
MRERINWSMFSSEMWMSRGQYCEFVPQAVMFNARLPTRRTLVAKVPLGAPSRFTQTDNPIVHGSWSTLLGVPTHGGAGEGVPGR